MSTSHHVRCIGFFKAILFIAVYAVITPAAACFDDKKLEEQRISGQASLIYVWSPRMVLSVTQAHLAAEQAAKAGLVFTPLVDGRISSAEWQSALQQLASSQQLNDAQASVLKNSQALCAPALIERDAYMHFPTAFVLQNQIIHPNKLVGAMPAQFWQQGIAQRIDKGIDNTNAKQASASANLEQCIAPNQFIALDPKLAGLDDNQQVALGAYERVSPDGRYILRSFSGSQLTTVSLVELPGPTLPNGQQIGKQHIYETPLSNEAFPVQGSWRYIVDTNGSHYTFKSILDSQTKAKPQFAGGMTGFYSVASEVDSLYPKETNKPIQIRSLSWPNADADGATQGMGTLSSATLLIDPVNHRKIANTGAITHCSDRASTDGSMYALPMISVDGTEFAALPQKPVDGVPTMRIFGLGADGKQCVPQGKFKLQSGKIIFGFSDKAKQTQANAAYEYRGHVWWYQRALDAQLNLAPWFDDRDAGTVSKPVYKYVTANAFPGITRDGRIVYAATWRRCTGQSTCMQEGGYVVADPWQSHAYKNHILANPNSRSQAGLAHKSCITVQDVVNERAAFSKFHAIAQ